MKHGLLDELVWPHWEERENTQRAQFGLSNTSLFLMFDLRVLAHRTHHTHTHTTTHTHTHTHTYNHTTTTGNCMDVYWIQLRAHGDT